MSNSFIKISMKHKLRVGTRQQLRLIPVLLESAGSSFSSEPYADAKEADYIEEKSECLTLLHICA